MLTIAKPIADGFVLGSDRAINIPVGSNARETQKLAINYRNSLVGERVL